MVILGQEKLNLRSVFNNKRQIQISKVQANNKIRKNQIQKNGTIERD